MTRPPRARGGPPESARVSRPDARAAGPRAARRAAAAPDAAAVREAVRSRWPIPPAAIALIFVAWALLFAPQLFAGRVYSLGDASVYRPFPEFSRARWLEHRDRTLWNPYVLLGVPAVPTLADPRPQYLPDALIDVYERVRMPRACPLAALLFAHLAGMLAAAALARSLWKSDAVGAAWAALAWGLMPGLLIPFAFGHDAQFVSASLMPVVLLCVHLTMTSQGRTPLAAALALALVMGIQCLTGHPQFIVYSGVFACAWAIAEAIRLRAPGRLALFAGAAGLGTAIAAAMWWPALLYSRHSLRSAGGTGVSLATVSRFSLAPRDLLSLVWPRAAGFGGDTYWGGMLGTDYSPYLGVTVVALAFWGWRAARDRRSSAAWLLAAVSIAAVLVSLGTHLGPAYAFLHAHVPMWSRFRVPFYALNAAQLGLALLSARVVGAAPPASRPPPWTHAQRNAVVAAVGVALLLGAGLAGGALSGAYAGWVHAARPGMPTDVARHAATSAGYDLMLRVALAGLAVAGLVFARHSTRVARAAHWGLLVILAVDLGSVSVPFLVRATGPASLISAPPATALARIAAGDPHARAYSTRQTIIKSPNVNAYSEASTNAWIHWRARSISGILSASPDLWRAVLGNQLMRFYQVLRSFGVVYLGVDPNERIADPRWFDRVATAGGDRVYRLATALGRVYAVPRVLAFETDQKVAEIMAQASFPPERAALTMDRAAAGNYPGSTACRIRWVEDEPDRIAIDTTAREPAFLVVADTFFPGWEARLDGESVPIHRVNLLLRGVAIPAGVHHLRMNYVPEGWLAAMWVTRWALAAWCALAMGLLVMGARPARRRPAPGRLA